MHVIKLKNSVPGSIIAKYMRIVFFIHDSVVHKKLVIVVRSNKTNRSCSESVASALTTKWCVVKATTGIYCI